MSKSKYSAFIKLNRQMADMAKREGAAAIVAGPKGVLFIIPGKRANDPLPKNWVKFLELAEKLKPSDGFDDLPDMETTFGTDGIDGGAK